MYKLEITWEIENSSVQGIYGYYTSRTKAEVAKKILLEDFGLKTREDRDSCDFIDAFNLEEVEVNKKPELM